MYRGISQNSKEIISETNDDPGYDPTEEWINSIALKELIYKLPQDEQELLLLRYANELQLLQYVRSLAFSFCYISQNLKDIEISQNRVAERRIFV